MFEKVKNFLPDFNLIELTKGIKELLTESEKCHFDIRKTKSCELIMVREGVDCLYPYNKVLHVKWDAGNYKDMILGDTPFEGSGFSVNERGSASDRKQGGANLISIISSVGFIAVKKVVNHWKKSFFETAHVGRDLARLIKQLPGDTQCILMGHSLGGRIVRHTLERLEPGNVSAAYILAGAVSSETEQWQEIFDNHTELKLINCMSQKDSVLKSVYKVGTLWDHEPAGLSPIYGDEHHNILNLDVSEFANGHTKFKCEPLGLFLKKELSQLTADKQKTRYSNGNRLSFKKRS